MEYDFEYLRPWPYERMSGLDQSHRRGDSLAPALGYEVGNNKTQSLPVLCSDAQLSCHAGGRLLRPRPIKGDSCLPNHLLYPSTAKTDLLPTTQHYTQKILPKRKVERYFNQPRSPQCHQINKGSTCPQESGKTSNSSRMLEFPFGTELPSANEIYPQFGLIDTQGEGQQTLDNPYLPQIRNPLLPNPLQTDDDPQLFQQEYPALPEPAAYQPDDFLWYEMSSGGGKALENDALPLDEMTSQWTTFISPPQQPPPLFPNSQSDGLFGTGTEKPLPLSTAEMIALFSSEEDDLITQGLFPDMYTPEEMMTPSTDTPPTFNTAQTNSPSAQTPGQYTVEWHTLDNDAFLEQSERAGSESIMNHVFSPLTDNPTPTSGQARLDRVSKGGRFGSRNTSKDEYLVRAKQQGMSYKQIKQAGAFEEAESTLRGRYRALTKEPGARVRKPQWTEGDVSSSIWVSEMFY